jgi:ribosomal protein S18 acetylase RimI-like enzyme
MDMDIIYRTGRSDDCSTIAEGIDKASGGIMDFLFAGFPGSPAGLLSAELAEEDGADSYRNAFVAVVEEKVIGIVYAYPAKFHEINEEMRNLFPQERLEQMEDFFTTRIENSLFLDSIYVDEAFRGRGIGSHLLQLVKDRAKAAGYPQVSLMVMADNERAQAVYKNSGFSVVKHVSLPQHRLIPHTGGAYLMVCAAN